jgi:hypothetical protein
MTNKALRNTAPQTGFALELARSTAQCLFKAIIYLKKQPPDYT